MLGEPMCRSSLLLCWSLMLALACTRRYEPAPETEVEVAPEPERAPTPIVPTLEPEPPPPPPPPPPPIEPTTIAPEDGHVQWRELPGFESITSLQPLVLGLLAQSGYTNYKLSKDGLLEQIDVEIPGVYADDSTISDEAEINVRVPGGFPDSDSDSRIWGEWRSDAWYVELSFTDHEGWDEDERGGVEWSTSFKIKRLRSTEWVTQKLLGVYQQADRGQQLRKGWAEGFIVYDRGRFHRLPESAKTPAPTRGMIGELGAVLDFFEARSGLLVLAYKDGRGLWIQPRCDDPECVRTRAHKLPEGGWDFQLDVPRGRDGLSIVADAVGQGDKPIALLHFDRLADGSDRVSLEFLPEVSDAPDAIWPDKHGGLWMWLGHRLGHRDPSGRWFHVALPPGCEGRAHFGAMRLVPREFVLLCVDEGGAASLAFAASGAVKVHSRDP
jgi:hypothetical protein